MSIDALQQQGLTGPFELADKSKVEAVREVAEELKALQTQENRVLALAGKPTQFRTMIDRHTEFDAMQALFSDVSLKSVITEHFGADLFLWGSVFQIKTDGVGENIWHHDRAFENGNDQLNLYDTSNHFTVLFALTDLGFDQGRLEYVKGSHEPIDGWNRELRFMKEIPEFLGDRVEALTLKQGEFAIFHSGVMHCSLPFRAGEKRVTLAVRLARNGTQIPAEYPQNPNPASERQGVAHFNPSATIAFN